MKFAHRELIPVRSAQTWPRAAIPRGTLTADADAFSGSLVRLSFDEPQQRAVIHADLQPNDRAEEGHILDRAG